MLRKIYSVFTLCVLICAFFGVFVNAFYYNVSIFGIFLCFFGFYLVKDFKPKIGVTLAVAFLVRLLFVLMFSIPPFSDYLIYKTGLSEATKPYFSAFPHALSYTLLVKPIVNNEIVVYILNAVVTTASIYMVYKLSDERCAFLVSLFPANIFYNALLSTEIPHTFLMLLAIYFVLNKKSGILVGLMVGLMNFIRPTGIIFILAYIIYNLTLKADFQKKILKITMAVLAYIFVLNLGNFVLGLFLNEPVNTSPFGYNLYVGQNLESLGRWNKEDYDFALSFSDGRVMHKELFFGAVKRFFQNGFWGNIKLILAKFSLTWGSGTLISHYMGFSNIGICLTQGFQLFLGYICFTKREKNTFLILLILGSVALYLITETMERYVYAIEIIMMIKNQLTIDKYKAFPLRGRGTACGG